jgi:hypothetical protein
MRDANVGLFCEQEILGDEDATSFVCGMTDKSSIFVEGVEVVQGKDPNGRFVIVVLPVAGESLLLFPFAG